MSTTTKQQTTLLECGQWVAQQRGKGEVVSEVKEGKNHWLRAYARGTIWGPVWLFDFDEIALMQAQNALKK